jgi:flavin-dependent dehydrogenase
MQRFDAVVIGAGTAGAAAAWHLARRGLSVALADNRRLNVAGARWVNGVPPWMFDEAEVPRPQAPERRGADSAFRLLGASGRAYLEIDPSPVWAVDMRALVARLQALAVGAGVTTFEQARVAGLTTTDGRPTTITLRQSDRDTTLGASLFVDATGLNAVVRRRVPALSLACPRVGKGHVCSAAQTVHRIADLDGAKRFLETHAAREGDVLCRMGVSGGYSIGNLTVDLHEGEVELLTGSIAGVGHASGPEIVRMLLAEHPWIGTSLFGGAGAIPLRRPYDRFVAPGLALVGNAACQVFPAHGSGIGIGMVAGRLLADAVADAADPGAEETLWRYQVSFQRRYGGLLAAYDVFRRLVQSLDGADVETLLAAGLINANGYRDGLDQRFPAPGVGDIRDLLMGVRAAPGLVARLVPALARMVPAAALYKVYPSDPRRLGGWSRAIAGVVS